jgi:hypothetical protein
LEVLASKEVTKDTREVRRFVEHTKECVQRGHGEALVAVARGEGREVTEGI